MNRSRLNLQQKSPPSDKLKIQCLIFNDLRGIECGGWRPKGRKAEDGRIAAKYPLIETPSANYVQRTEWNVRDTGGTVILSIEHELTGGSRKTAEFAVKHHKPCLHVHSGSLSLPTEPAGNPANLHDFQHYAI